MFEEARRLLREWSRGPCPRPPGRVESEGQGLAWDAIRGSLLARKWRGTVAEFPGSLRPLAAEAETRLAACAPTDWPMPDFAFPAGAGCGTFGHSVADGTLSALASGAVLLDTAEGYGFGRVETALGAVLPRARPFRALIASKVSRTHMRAPSVANAVGRTLRRLRLSRLDLYQTHWPSPRVPVAETMRAMARLLDAGTVGAVGLCNVSVDQLVAAQRALPAGHRIASVQTRWNVEDREAEWALVPYCRRHRIAVIAYSPLGQDFRAMLARPAGAALCESAVRAGVTPAQAALGWLLARGALPIPRSNDACRAAENTAARPLSPFEAEPLGGVA